MAIPLPKMEKKIMKSVKELKKKLSRSQYFHNKSHVINYYQFKKICDKLILAMALPKSGKKIKYNLHILILK